MSVPTVKLKSVKSGSQDWYETGKDQKRSIQKILVAALRRLWQSAGGAKQI